MRTITLNDAIIEYTNNVIASYGSPGTRRAHDSTMEVWRKWIVGQTQTNVLLRDVDHNLISRYFATVRPPACRETTFNNRRQRINAFWVFCQAEGWVNLNPCRYITRLKVPKKPKLRLSATELKNLIEMAENPRDRILIVTAINTGLRAQDLANLKIGDVDLNRNVITPYVQKIKASDEFRIDKFFRRELLDWFDAYATYLDTDVNGLRNNYFLIPPLPARRLEGGAGYRTVASPLRKIQHPERLMRPYYRELGFDSHDPDSDYDRKATGLGLHVLRRSAARVILDEAAVKGYRQPMRVAMTFLGHASEQTTELYVGVDLDRAERDELMADGFLEQAVEREAEDNAKMDATRALGHAGNEFGRRRYA